MDSTSTPIPANISAGTVQNQVFRDQHIHGDQIFNAPSDTTQSPVRDCLRSLAYAQMNDRSNTIRIPTGGTCEWLLGHRQWKSWASSQRGLLWIKGKPGSGKSTLLRYALHEFKSTKSAKKALILSFFFHGRGHDLQRSPLGLFRSLLYQVLSEMPEVLSKFVATFEQRRDGIGRPGAGWAWELDELHESFKWSILDVLNSRPVWIFVDALDECGAENAKTVIRHFKDLLQGPSARSQLHICFACRHYPIHNWYSSFEICTEHENREDILTYIRAQLSDFESPTTLSLTTLITERSNGLFIWARLVVDKILDLELADDPSRANEMINKTIDTLPQDLDDLYLELVRGMKGIPACLKLVQWIAYSRRPLSLDELRWAMAVDPDLPHTSLLQYKTGPWCTEDSDMVERRIKTLSRGLVEIISSSNTRIVQFIHQSVKDFFDTRALETLEEGSEKKSHSIPGAVHYQLYRASIHYLAMEATAQTSSRTWYDTSRWYNFSQSTLLSSSPLLSYAATSWIMHLERSEQGRRAGSQHFDLPSETAFEEWLKFCRLVDEDSMDRPPVGINLVHVLARHGLVVPLQTLLGQGGTVDMNARDCYGRTPLLYAAERGHAAIVQVLLAAGAKVDRWDLSGAAPLHWAVFRGHTDATSLLLAGGADISLEDTLGCTPLAWAIEGRQEVNTKMLLEKDPDLNCDYQLPTFHFAGFSDTWDAHIYEACFGVDSGWRVLEDEPVNDRFNFRAIPWMPMESKCEASNLRALFGGWDGLWKRFWGSNDYHPIGPGRNGARRGHRTPLLRAVELGLHSIVRMLIAKGADPYFECKNGVSPMALAKWGETELDKKITKLLEV